MDFMLIKEPSKDEIVPFACGTNDVCKGCRGTCKGCNSGCSGCTGSFMFG